MKKVLLVLLVIVLLAGTNAGQYFLWDKNMEGVSVQYQNQIDAMQITLNEIGPMVSVYSVKNTTVPGTEIKQDDLTAIQVPSSVVSDYYIMDPSVVVGKFYKVAVNPRTPLTSDLIMETSLDNTLREVDIIADVWPIGLAVGDYVDLEINYPLGEKYRVLSHVRIEAVNSSTVKVLLDGTQRYLYGYAFVDYIIQKSRGSSFELVKYPEPGVQVAASVTYAVPAKIVSLVANDPDILIKLDNATNAKTRADILESITAVTDEEASAVASGRSAAISSVNGASDTYAQQLEQEAEQAAMEAFEAAGEQPIVDTSGETVTETTTIEVEEGVVE
jgi:hypothetical protein